MSIGSTFGLGKFSHTFWLSNWTSPIGCWLLTWTSLTVTWVCNGDVEMCEEGECDVYAESLLSDFGASFFAFMRRFWNQIFTVLSGKFNWRDNSARYAVVGYVTPDLKIVSISFNWSLVKVVRMRFTLRLPVVEKLEWNVRKFCFLSSS